MYEFQINEQLRNACQFVLANADQILTVEDGGSADDEVASQYQEIR